MTKDKRQFDFFNSEILTQVTNEQRNKTEEFYASFIKEKPPEIIKPKPILLIDMDGVMANYYGSFLEGWKRRYPNRGFIPEGELKSFYIEDSYAEEHNDDIRELTTARGFFRGIKPIPGAIETLRKILSERKFEPFICTAPEVEAEGQCCFSEKAEWVDHLLGREWTERLILTKDKTLVHGDFLLDDKPVIKGINRQPSWERIVFHQSYNGGVVGKRLNGWENWNELEDILLGTYDYRIGKVKIEDGIDTDF